MTCSGGAGTWVGERLGDAAAYLSLSALCAGSLAAVLARARVFDLDRQGIPAEKPI